MSEKNNFYDKIIEKLPGNVWWKDKELKYLGCNDRVLNILGFNSRNDFIGKTDYDFWEYNIASELEKADLYILQTGETINLEEIIVEHTGREAIMLTNKSPLLGKNGEVIGILGTSTDITELKQVQSQLREAEERLAGIRSLSAGIAHELRTPLSAIQFSVQGAKNYLPSLVEAYNLAKEHHLPVKPIRSSHLKIMANVLDSINSEVRYSETIINMILMNVKQTGISKADFDQQEINACVTEAMLRYPFKPGEKELVEWKPNNNFLFIGDITLIEHVLFNLLKNALYFIEAAKKGSINIWCEILEDNNKLCFRDTAMGIPHEELPKLFTKFYTTTRHGTGLGLAFCKTVMTSLGGDIICHSEYGKYTRFELIFPKLDEANNYSRT